MLAALLALALAADPVAADAVRADDLAMARAVAARDAAAFEACVDPEAIFAGAGGLLVGRAAIAAGWSPFFAPEGPTLAWTPERAVVAASGDLAFTTGSFAWEGDVAPGRRGRVTGAYVSVWRRSADGTWRALLDASLEPAARLGDGLVRRVVRTVSSRAGDVVATAGTWTRGADAGVFVTVAHRTPSGEDAIDTALVARAPARP